MTRKKLILQTLFKHLILAVTLADVYMFIFSMNHNVYVLAFVPIADYITRKPLHVL